jgi:hypothetical protein
VRKFGGHVLTVGFAFMAMGFAMAAFALEFRPLPDCLFYTSLLAAGIGHGIVLPSIVRIVLVELDPASAGLASGVVISTLQIGSAFGTAAISGVFFAVLGSQTRPEAYAHAFQSGLLINSGLLFGCLGLCVLLVRHQTTRQKAAGFLELRAQTDNRATGDRISNGGNQC